MSRPPVVFRRAPRRSRRARGAWRSSVPSRVGTAWLLAWALGSSACDGPSDDAGSSAEPAAAAGLPAPSPPAAAGEPSATAPPEAQDGASEPVPDAGQAPPAGGPPAWAERALDLEALLGREGWARDADVSADTFVISPEGTRMAAGRFSAGEHAGAVAVFVYPHERFARPHAVDLRERMRLLPAGVERGLREGPAVVHIRGDDAASARALAEVLSSVLGAPGVEESVATP